ncbi:rRNA maturation RNase YbeY [Pelagibacterales bacterium SAG-MED28]|nr:rRNA maturation RNase YbeY [Pelagibacterales bacterium SAG-MED28]|tara:strand:- start:1519 stop:1986 length:468 start_codon:yes stop_codon:yes gene_type:complete
MIKINVITNNIKWFSYIKNPNNYLDRKLNKLNLKDEMFRKKSVFGTLLLSDDNEIKYLNRKFRKKNTTTDVLSFPFQTKPELKKKLKKEKEIYLGDIIINLSKIKNKKRLKNFKFEFDRLWIHGLVHLLGHDHKKDKDFLKMIRIEKKYFETVNV